MLPNNPTTKKFVVPDLNPIIATAVFCPTCGDIVMPEATKKANGRLNEIFYRHRNEEVGCGWILFPSKQHILGGAPRALKADEEAELAKQAFLAAIPSSPETKPESESK